jgi:hypothetical protein
MSVALDLKHFERALDGSHMPLSFDSEKIRAHRSNFWVTAAEEDGTKVLINAKADSYEPLHAVLASIAVPGTCEPVMLEGRRLVDGVAGGNPLPVEEGLSLLPLREGERAKVLVLQSRIHPKYRPLEYWAWPFLAHMRFAFSPSGLRSNMAYIDSCFASAADKLSLMRAIDYCRVAPTLEDVTLLPTPHPWHNFVQLWMKHVRLWRANLLRLEWGRWCKYAGGLWPPARFYETLCFCKNAATVV